MLREMLCRRATYRRAVSHCSDRNESGELFLHPLYGVFGWKFQSEKLPGVCKTMNAVRDEIEAAVASDKVR